MLPVSRFPLTHNTQATPLPRLVPLTCGRVCTLPMREYAAAWANSPCLLNIKVVWRVHCKLPDVMGTVQQLSAGIISADPYMSAKRLPLYEAVRTLPVCLLAFLTRAVNPRCPNNELVGRVRKPPDVSEHRLLDEAINKAEIRRRDHLPTPRPAPAFAPPAHSQWCTAHALPSRHHVNTALAPAPAHQPSGSCSPPSPASVSARCASSCAPTETDWP